MPTVLKERDEKYNHRIFQVLVCLKLEFPEIYSSLNYRDVKFFVEQAKKMHDKRFTKT